MRVGVLGGTFDPVHLAHLVLAEQARSRLALDLVLFIPAGQPWRKGQRVVTAADHRLAMLRLAVDGEDGFGISDSELRRDGPTYTADTLEALAGERLDDEFFFIVGADALADMAHWHEPERIVRHAALAVAARDGRPPAAVPDLGAARPRIEAFEMPRLDVSSSAIRRAVAAGRSVRFLVPAAVERYIAEHALYRTAEAAS